MDTGSIIFSFEFAAAIAFIFRIHRRKEEKRLLKMAISDLLNRRMRAKPDDDGNDEEVYSQGYGSEQEQDEGSDQSDEERDDEGSGDEMVSHVHPFYRIKKPNYTR